MTSNQPTFGHGGNAKFDEEVVMNPTATEHHAPKCNRCGKVGPEDDFVPAWGRCKACVQRSQEEALSNYVLAMSEKVVEIPPFGWCTARCALGDPVDWLCWHIHRRQEDAEECLAQTLAEGRGIFPIR
jgi:hypothetical protein